MSYARLTARCACGQAAITVEGEPKIQGVCHCDDCKRRTGSAFGISSYFPTTRVVSTDGETRVYAFRNVQAEHDQARHFCARCGTTLYWHISALPALVGIAGGCFAQEGMSEPGYSANHDMKERWVGLPDAWPKDEGARERPCGPAPRSPG